MLGLEPQDNRCSRNEDVDRQAERPNNIVKAYLDQINEKLDLQREADNRFTV